MSQNYEMQGFQWYTESNGLERILANKGNCGKRFGVSLCYLKWSHFFNKTYFEQYLFKDSQNNFCKHKESGKKRNQRHLTLALLSSPSTQSFLVKNNVKKHTALHVLFFRIYQQKHRKVSVLSKVATVKKQPPHNIKKASLKQLPRRKLSRLVKLNFNFSFKFFSELNFLNTLL